MAPGLRSRNHQETSWALAEGNRHRGASLFLSLNPVWAIAFLLASTVVGSEELSSPLSSPYRVYDVLLVRHSDTYHPRTYRALLASDGSHHRVAFYWLDPAPECELMDGLSFSDFLFQADTVTYWYHKDPNERHVLPLKIFEAELIGGSSAHYTLERVFQAILTVVVYNRTPLDSAGNLEMARFFRQCRQGNHFEHTVEGLPADQAGDMPASSQGRDHSILDQLPFGRNYSKQTDREGNIVWRISKASVPMEMVSMAGRPISPLNIPAWSEVTDPNTLGRWSAVPDAYRQYWRMQHRSIKLRRTPNNQEAQRLYDDITSYLQGSLPDELDVATHELLFRVSLQTGSSEAISSAGQRYFRTYVRMGEQPVEKILVELGRIARELRARWADDETRDFVLPLLRPLIDPKVFSDPAFVKDAILGETRLRGPTWSWYEQLLLESIQIATDSNVRSSALVSEIPDMIIHAIAGVDSEAK